MQLWKNTWSWKAWKVTSLIHKIFYIWQLCHLLCKPVLKSFVLVPFWPKWKRNCFQIFKQRLLRLPEDRETIWFCPGRQYNQLYPDDVQRLTARQREREREREREVLWMYSPREKISWGKKPTRLLLLRLLVLPAAAIRVARFGLFEAKKTNLAFYKIGWPRNLWEFIK